MFYIYRITNLVNGKTYIGQHKFSLNKDDNYMGSGKHLKRAQKKYGIKNFKKDIIEVVPTLFEANVLEKYYIAKERAKVSIENCYNIASGGQVIDGYSRSGEWRIKQSKSHKGKPAWNKGKTNIYTQESLKKMSEARKGKPAWNKGIPCSDKQKKKISETEKGRPSLFKGKHHTDESKRKIGEVHKGKPLSEEHKKKLSEARKGRHWYNNGKENKFCYECPEGFVSGKLV